MPSVFAVIVRVEGKAPAVLMAAAIAVFIDAMDQGKTKIPYFTRPNKSIGNHYGLQTKLFSALVLVLGYYLFFSICQIQTWTNLTTKVLRHTLNKIQHEFGFLPPIFHLQLDNASDNKSHQFLAFIAYFVQHHTF